MKYSLGKHVSSKYLVWLIGSAVVIVLVGGVVLMRKMYSDNLKPLSHLETSQLITIPKGASTQEIANILEDKAIIREGWAFEWYVRISAARDKLQAGTYALKPSLSVQQIVDIMTQGSIARDLVTVLPGKRLDEIRDGLINAGFEASAVDQALEPGQYQGHPALVDKPAEATLEGYLYPESFERTADTTPQQIVRQSLDQMQKYLTPDLRTAIAGQGLTVHQGVILASIVEREVSRPEDKPKVAQVFLRRLREGMKLESDATASYGAVLAGQEPNSRFDSAYNTYSHGGLTPSPISNVNESSLKAVAYPDSTNYLYFVSGDDGRTHFSHTLQEHQALTRQYCTKLCR